MVSIQSIGSRSPLVQPASSLTPVLVFVIDAKSGLSSNPAADPSTRRSMSVNPLPEYRAGEPGEIQRSDIACWPDSSHQWTFHPPGEPHQPHSIPTRASFQILPTPQRTKPHLDDFRQLDGDFGGCCFLSSQYCSQQLDRPYAHHVGR